MAPPFAFVIQRRPRILWATTTRIKKLGLVINDRRAEAEKLLLQFECWNKCGKKEFAAKQILGNEVVRLAAGKGDLNEVILTGTS